MCKSFSVSCFLFFLISAFIGCTANNKTEETATKSSLENKTANASKPEVEQKQYQAVCITKGQHEGNEYILTKWLDSEVKARMYGGEHQRKKKAHNVIYRERIKPSDESSLQ